MTTIDIVHRLRRWAGARERRNPFGHGSTGTALLREAADEIERLRRDVNNQQKLAENEVPDDVRAAAEGLSDRMARLHFGRAANSHPQPASRPDQGEETPAREGAGS